MARPPVITTSTIPYQDVESGRVEPGRVEPVRPDGSGNWVLYTYFMDGGDYTRVWFQGEWYLGWIWRGAAKKDPAPAAAEAGGMGREKAEAWDAPVQPWLAYADLPADHTNTVRGVPRVPAQAGRRRSRSAKDPHVSS